MYSISTLRRRIIALHPVPTIHNIISTRMSIVPLCERINIVIIIAQQRQVKILNNEHNNRTAYTS